MTMSPSLFLMAKAKLILLSIILLGVGIVVLTALFLFAPASKVEENHAIQEETSCHVERTTETVRGASMEPLIKNGQTIIILQDYYKCYPVERGDIVVYRVAEDLDPVIKIVRGIPGDEFSLGETSEAGVWHLLINGETAKTSEGVFYRLDRNGYNMLSLYVKDYKGVIPQDAYLILGNIPSGSFDSTRFGLISRSDLVGKAVTE